MSKLISRINRNFSLKMTLFILLTLVISVIAYFGIMALYGTFLSSVQDARQWSLLEGFASVITLAFIIGGLTYTIGDRIRAEVTETREKTMISYEIYKSIFEKLTNPEEEAARRWILVNIQPPAEGEDADLWFRNTQEKVMECTDGKTGLPEGQKSVKMTLNCLDYIGFIAKNYWDISEKEDSLDWLSPPVAKIWIRLGPYVQEIRQQRKADDYYVFAEYIGTRCLERRKSRNLPDEEKNTNIP